MSEFFEIAYAAASGRLCLFTGTGFSKALTNDAAPTWKELLEKCCEPLENAEELKAALFPAKEKNLLSPEEAAVVIHINLSKDGKSIHEEIAKYIASIKLQGKNPEIKKFFTTASTFKIVTTNFDKLAEALIGKGKCQSIAPGLPIPRSDTDIEIYHIHGSIDSPTNMVVTADDYFNFLNNDSYFSRKLSTLLHENTVVILGYSLSDTNLKAIISEYNGVSRNQATWGNIIFVARRSVEQCVKDYYANCYGIRVLDSLEIDKFFDEVNKKWTEAQDCVKESKENLVKVLDNGKFFTDDYLKTEGSFFEIISSITAVGRSVNDANVVKMLGKIIKHKKGFSEEYEAWEQYVHLATWLVHLGALVDLKKTPIKDVFLEATLHSMSKMSRQQLLGYSWEAYNVWSRGWMKMIANNRKLIRDYIKIECYRPDALNIVEMG